MTLPVVERGRPHSWAGPVPMALAVAFALATAWAVTLPRVPDLSAQLARAEVAATHGLLPFWTGWYGGTATLGYSVFAPLLVGTAGPRVVGFVAAAVAAGAGGLLMRGSRRPRAGAVALAALAVSDVCLGRLTFAAGYALGLVALVLSRRGRTSSAAVLSALCGLTSPLAGAFLALGYLSAGVAGAGPLSRRRWAVLVGATAAPVGVLELMFPQPGFEPVSVGSALGALLACGLVAALSPHRPLRLAALLTAGLVLSTWVVPNALGGNAVRLPEMAALPLLVATAQRPGWLHVHLRWTRAVHVVVAALAVVPVLLPATALASGLAAADSPAAAPGYWQPLAARLATAPGAGLHRVEVVPTPGHWEVQYLTTGTVLARGWERQADEAVNPLFYGRAPLTQATYRSWLDSLAVAYVAVPDQQDFSGAAEAALVASAPPYLSLVWQNAHWRLYAVDHPAPMVVGAGRLVSMTPTSTTVDIRGTQPVLLRLRWSSYLTFVGSPGCLSQAGDWTQLQLAAPGSVTLQSGWRPTASQVEDLCPPAPGLPSR